VKGISYIIFGLNPTYSLWGVKEYLYVRTTRGVKSYIYCEKDEGYPTLNRGGRILLTPYIPILPSISLKNLYYSLFHCPLVYAIELWSAATNTTLYPLITKEKTAVRIIANINYNNHTEPMFKEFSILPLSDLRNTSNLKFVHSYVFNYVPTAFTNTWPTVGQFCGENPNLETS
jgi:hypothetical protein